MVLAAEITQDAMIAPDVVTETETQTEPPETGDATRARRRLDVGYH